MKKQSNLRSLFVVSAAVLLLLCGNTSVFAQSDATRRLLVATSGGFEFNEAAAKDALAAGADINWKNDAMDGETMLISAIKSYKEAKVIKFLLDNGADAGIKDDTGKTALEWARQRNIGRDRNGREIIAMLEAAAGQTTATTTPKTTPVAKPEKTNKPAPSKPAPSKPAPANTTGKPRRTGGAPTDGEIKEAIEQKFTNDYIRHFFGIDNKVTFEWTGGITVGALQSVRSAPKPCYPVKLQVSVTAEDPRDGNTSTVVRGMNATTGNYREEIFCFYRDGFGEWAFGVYGK